MKVAILNSEGQEVNIKDLDPAIIRKIGEKNPFLGIMLSMEALKAFDNDDQAKEAVVEEPKPDLVAGPGPEAEAPEVNLFKEEAPEPECSGNPDDCPICGNRDNDDDNPYLADLSQAIGELNQGSSVTRRAWVDAGVTGYLVQVPERTEGPFTFSSYLAFFDTEELEFSPYAITNEDLLAEDWLLIDNN